ncbi:probable carboxylesterase 2 [Gastrolobium bilobum]|uniref:probable carboxylesterase 2 n=1 Tax=Gastrolobium bilobum TaxID=150636 RepID=UPI002AB2B2C6|nr:probable carboxylesterase 2 [Gastrolobium bilobum]
MSLSVSKFQMDSSNPEISVDVPPYLRVHKDGTLERIAGTQVVPAGFDSETNVVSKDIIITPETGVTARLYRPNFTAKTAKLPLVIYFHGGAFCISSVSDPLYHNSLNKLVSEANVVALSVNYRLAPEHPLPAAFQDSWAAVQWVASHAAEAEDHEYHEPWLRDKVDFGRVFLAGDSAGANIGHYMALRLHVLESGLTKDFKVPGLIMVNPYFWGKEPIGVEITDPVRKKMVDKWWDFVCPSDKGNDDPLINPFVEEAPGFEGLGCKKVLVIVAERDILRERGKLYHKKLVNSGWKGTAEFYETQGEDHVFHIFDPNCDKAKSLVQRMAAFINEH